MGNQGEGFSLTNRILQLIEVALKKVQAAIIGTSTTGATGIITAVHDNTTALATAIEDATEAVEAGNQIIGSGINLEDGSGPGTEPFDSAFKLRMIEDDTSTGITYVGYSAPDLATSVTGWFVQRITSVETGTTTTHTEVYGIGEWDNRATLTYV